MLWSDENVKSRKSKRYISGRNEMITPQLGLNFHVDLTELNDWMIDKGVSNFGASIVLERKCNIFLEKGNINKACGNSSE